MNIILYGTKEEILQLLSKATNSIVTGFVIQKTPKIPDILTEILTKMAVTMKCFFVDPNTPCDPSQKIAYIKALRDATGTRGTDGVFTPLYGLAEAKTAVENWVDFCAFIKTHGKMPRVATGWNSCSPLFS